MTTTIKELRICLCILSLMFILPFIPIKAYADDYKEIVVSLEVKERIGSLLYVTIMADGPYFEGFPDYGDGDLVFKTSPALMVQFTRVNQFKIEVELNDNQLDFIKNFRSVKFEYPEQLIYTSEELRDEENRLGRVDLCCT